MSSPAASTGSASEARISVESLVRVGDTINGKYRVDRVLGEGGMGIVVEAMHLGLDEKVALKFLHRAALENPEVVQRFEFEAKAASKLKSEHVARVNDVDRLPDGSLFIVMEYLAGRNLAEELEERGPLPVEEAVEYIIQACEGLAEAHARGTVHRDIKPENIFIVSRDGMKSAKVLDFGISKIAIEGAAAVEKNSTTMMGSPYYMAPEQLRLGDLDSRVDIWSIGAVLFELLTGHTPFSNATELPKLFSAIVHSPHQRIASLRTDIPPELAKVIDTCLEKDREDRYPSAADLAIELIPFGHKKRSRVVAERAVSFAQSGGATVRRQIMSIPPTSGVTPLRMDGAALPSVTDLASIQAIGAVPERAAAENKKKNMGLLVVPVLLLLVAAFFVLRPKANVAESTTPVNATASALTAAPEAIVAKPEAVRPAETAVPAEPAVATPAPPTTPPKHEGQRPRVQPRPTAPKARPTADDIRTQR